jgi:hypothetical protein
MIVGDGRVEIPFEATRDKKKTDDKLSFFGKGSTSQLLSATSTVSMIFAFSNEDEISGSWIGVIENEQLPGGQIEFTIDVKMNDKNKLSGTISSPQGELEIISGSYDPKTKSVDLEASGDDVDVEIEGKVAKGKMDGTLMINGGEIELDFEATMEKKAEPKEKDEEKRKKDKTEGIEGKSKAEKKAADVKKPAKTSSEKSASSEGKKQDESEDDKTESKAESHPITGRWVGQMTSDRGEQEAALNLKYKSDKSITGSYESSRGDNEFSSGTYDPESKTLTLLMDNGRFTMEFSGVVKGDKFNGDVDINDGAFSMTFETTKSSDEPKESENEKDAEVDATVYEQPTGEKTLSGLMPGPRWVSSIETSHFKKDRCYISFDGHRSDDDGIYVFKTEDAGKSWESIRANLPDNAGSVRVIREDLKSENLLFLGCEFSSWYSIDAGKSWTRIKGGLPTVSVHEFAIHPSAGEVVAGTHGRSLWVADISILRQLSSDTLSEDVFLYQSKDAIVWSNRPGRGNSGTRRFVGTNPDRGTKVAFSLNQNARNVSLIVTDLMGDVVKTFEVSNRAGLHTYDWNLQRDQPSSGRRGFRSVPPGKYLLKLRVDGVKRESVITVKIAEK